ncbi:MAG: serine hydrolase domain-containing protein [Planctomycetota bacterium]
MNGGAALPRLTEALEQGLEQGRHLGAVACVDRGGSGGIVAVAVGEARPDQPLTPGTPMLWMSTTKPITAMAIAWLWERGDVELDAPVARYVPEFAQRDKGGILVKHLLTHTAGLRPSPFRYPDDDWATIVEKVCAMRVEQGWAVGSDAGYHVHSTWFILGEIVRRVSGTALPTFVRSEFFEPLGMTRSWIGMSDRGYEQDGELVSPVYDTSGAEPIEQPFTQRAWLTGTRPGGNGVGPLSELVAFYRALLDTLDRRRSSPWTTTTVQRFVRRERRDTYDKTFQHVMDWGLGIMVNSARHGRETLPYDFGPAASDDAFGHGGYQSSVVFADPVRDLVVAVAFNGFPGELAHQSRMKGALRAIEDDLATLGAEASELAQDAGGAR